MDRTTYQRVRTIYFGALDLEEAARQDYVAHACGGDVELRAALERLLQAQSKMGQFMESPALASGLVGDLLEVAEGAPPAALPERIGRYRILRLLGEGGMGSVYEAEQDSPKRRVAVKVLLSGILQRRMLQRFRREIELLGRMQHPGIARIYEAGIADLVHDDGRMERVPFFAMELIEGQPITTYAKLHQLTLHQKLELLAWVCDAVHFGHQHHVVHRDLKPANILVTDAPDAPGYAPKVIDFGVARVTDGDTDAALTTLSTEAGQVLGTLAYMSPEQVRGDTKAIDARSDVYALGVVGHEMLAGRLPYDIAGKSAPEVARIICEDDGRRLSSDSRTFRGDIEAIFLKALQKEPEQRYASAAAFASDLRRFLAHEPITARVPSLRYQLGKLARRHKEFVAGLALVFVVLVAGIVATALALVHALEQQGAATRAAAIAEAEAERATAESRRSERLRQTMQRVFSYATPGTPGRGRDAKVVDMMNAAEELLGELEDAPDIEMEMRRTLGLTYARLADGEKAQLHYARAVELAAAHHGPASLEFYDLSAEAALARHLPYAYGLDNVPDFNVRAEQWLSSARALAPPEHPKIQRLLYVSGRANSLNWRGVEAYDRFTELLRITRSLPPEQRVYREVEVKAALIAPLSNMRRFREAEEMARSALDSIDDVPRSVAFRVRISALIALGQIASELHRLDEAVTHLEDALELQLDVLGIEHPETADTIAILRDVMLRLKCFEDALRLNAMEDHSEQRRRRMDKWRGYLFAYEGLILSTMGRTAEARPWFQSAVAFRRQEFGIDFMAQEWWRGGIKAAGNLHQPWISESTRRFLEHHVDRALTQSPSFTLELDELLWSQADFQLRLWNGRELVQLDAGPYQGLRERADPEPGLYRWTVRCPRRAGPDLLIEEWMLAAPWQLDLFRAFRVGDAPDPTVAVIEGPHEQRFLPGLMHVQTYTDPLGPDGAQVSFGIDARARLELPAGKYRLRVYFDDGARLWMDEHLLIDAYRWPHEHPRLHAVEVEWDGKSHELRVEYFQHGNVGALWISAEPMTYG